MDVLGRLLRAHGAVRIDDLMKLGARRAEIQHLIDDGIARAEPGGVLVMPNARAELVVALRSRAILCGTSAATWWGMAVLHPSPHVTLAIARGTSRRAVPGVAFRRRQLTAYDVEPDIPVTTPLRTVLDCCRALPEREAQVVADSAVHKGLVTVDQLVCAARALAGPGSATARRVARQADGRCMSAIETLQRLVLLALPLSFELQVFIPGVGLVDALVEGRLVVEADGFEFHSNREEYRNDRRRANALMTRGYSLLRFTYEDLVLRPEHVGSHILEALVTARAG